jgi:hypothetical protein
VKASPLVDFYSGTGTDDRGRSMADILAWDDTQLEQVHDYIQWLFPLPTRSAYNPFAPVLSAADIAAFREDGALQERVEDAFARILAFYGFERVEGQSGPVVRQSPKFPERSPVWLTRQNHNHLRLSRILRFLVLAGLEPLALAFWRALDEVSRAQPHIVGERTARFWREAAEA